MPAEALKLAVEELTILPPSFDLSKALAIASDLRDFERIVSRAEPETLAWRARTMAGLRAGREQLHETEQSISREAIAEILLPELSRIQDELAAARAGIAVPFDERPEVARTYDHIAGISPEVARLIRKQFRRIEVIRQNLLDSYEVFSEFLLALEWDFDPAARGGPAFDNPDDLIARLNAWCVFRNVAV
jgi:hypothetical protein